MTDGCIDLILDLVTNGVVITDAIKFVQQKKEELNQMNSNNATSGEEEEANKISKKEKEKEEVLDSDNMASKNTKNQIF